MTHEGAWSEDEAGSGRVLYLRVLEAIRLVLREQLWPDTAVASYPVAAEHGPVTDDVTPRTGCAG